MLIFSDLSSDEDLNLVFSVSGFIIYSNSWHMTEYIMNVCAFLEATGIIHMYMHSHC